MDPEDAVTPIRHRTFGDAFLDRLQGVILDRATLRAVVDGVEVYEADAGKFFTYADGAVQPISQATARTLLTHPSAE